MIDSQSVGVLTELLLRGTAASVLNIVWPTPAPAFIIIQALGMQWAGASGVSISGPLSTRTDLELQQF